MDKATSREFRTRIETVLLEQWDPCEVADEPMAADEYSAYVYGVMRLLLEGAPTRLIEQHLADIERERMGMTGGESERRTAAAVALRRLTLPMDTHDRQSNER